MIELVLDSREIALKKELADITPAIQFTTEQLPIGDIVFRNEQTKEIILLCERKSFSDLYSSILSGRYAEQRERIKTLSSIKVIYIIEEYSLQKSKSVYTPPNKHVSAVETVGGSLENLVLFHDIHVLPTLNLAHTAKTICNIYKKLLKNPLNDKKTTEEAIIVSSMMQKKDKVMQNIHKHQLLLIPGVSATTATILFEKYPTVSALVDAYKNCATILEKEQMLANVQLGKRKLGNALSKKICEVYAYA